MIFLNRLIKPYKGIPKNAWLLALVLFINRSGSIVLVFLTLYLTKELGYSIADAGLVLSIFGLGALFGNYLGGYFTDEVNPYVVQMVSLLGTAIGFASLAHVTTYISIAVISFVTAIFSESFRPANAASVALAVPEKMRARGYVLNRLALNLGFSIGPAVGGLLAGYGYNFIFYTDALTCIGAAFALWFFFGRGEGILNKKLVHLSNEKVKFPFNDYIFLVVLLFLLFLGMTFFQIMNTLPVYFKDFYYFDESTIGLLLAFNAFFVAIFEMPLIYKIEKYNNVNIIAIGALFILGGFGLTVAGNTLFWAVFTVILWSIGEMLVFPLIQTFIANRSNDRNRGRYMGMIGFTMSSAFMIGPIGATFTYEYLGPNWVWYIILIWAAIIPAGFLFLKPFISKENKRALTTN